MAISIDWGTRVISVPQADLTLLGGSNYSLNTEAFRLALRDLEDGELGIIFPKTHNHSTQVLLGGVSYARIIEIINGYTITFEETGSPYTVSLIGSNNNIVEVTNLGTVQLLSNNSAGLINVTELQQDAFAGAVHYEAGSGNSGTIYPTGTPLYPVDNFVDAVAIANSRGFESIHITGNATITTGDVLSGFKISGQNAARSMITLDPGAVLEDVEIRDAHVTGTLDGGSILRECLVSNMSFVNGFVFECMLATGTFTLGVGQIGHFLSCYSGVPGAATPIIDCAGDGPGLAIRDYNGGIKLVNKTGSASVSIDLNSGQVILDNTVTAGTIVVRGAGKLIDINGDTIHSGAWNGATIVNETINGSHLHDIHDAHFRRRVWSSVNNTITIYEEDGVTPKFVFDTNADLSDIDPQ